MKFLLASFVCSLPLVCLSQNVSVSVLPAKSLLLMDGKVISSPSKIPTSLTETAVIAYKNGYVTQGQPTKDLLERKVNYHFVLTKVSCKPSSAKLQKIKFDGFLDQTPNLSVGKFVHISHGLGYTLPGINIAELQYFQPVQKLLADSGYKIVGKNAMFQEIDEEPDFLLGAEVTWAGKYKLATGYQAGVLVTWSLLSVDQDKVVHTSKTAGFSSTGGNKKYNEELAMALKNAALGLMSDTVFKKTVASIDSSLYERLFFPVIAAKKFSGYGELVKENIKSVMTVKTDKGHGSGFFITEDGYALTNHHVITGAENIVAILENGFEVEAKVIRSDKLRDVALLKIAGKGFKPLSLHSGTESQGTGSEVITIGTPQDLRLGQTVTKGIVSGKRKFDKKNFIQTDVTINPGNSGGPLIETSSGKVIGIIVSGYNADVAKGIGFAIPIQEALDEMKIQVQ